MVEATPEERASRAAEALAAAGVAVTARAVRERSGVRMALAADAARQWNAEEAERHEAPDVPHSVQTRFDAVWREAYTAARGEFDEARAGWEAKVRRSEEEAAQLAAAVEEAEQECERSDAAAAADRERATEELAAARAEAAEQLTKQAALLSTERSRADRAEGALEAVTLERDRLLVEIDSLRNAARGGQPRRPSGTSGSE